MKLRQLNDLILEADKENPYDYETVDRALFERLRQLLVDESIDTLHEFIRFIKQDLDDLNYGVRPTA